MTEDRKAELAQMCSLEIRRTVTLIRMGINDGDKEVDDVIDGEFWAMLTRIRAKQITEADLPTLRELVEVSLGLDELDRGEHVDIDDVLAKARAIVDDAKNPPLNRDTPHVASEEMDESNDPLRATDLGRQIDDDTWSKKGREQELLIEFGYYIQDAVKGAVVKAEHLDEYISKELSGWSTYARVPLSERDREFLHRYISELVREEYERVKGK